MNLLLLEPIISQFFGVFMGVDQWPGWMTFFGAFLAMVAINVMY